jgi:hypothetical protein
MQKLSVVDANYPRIEELKQGDFLRLPLVSGLNANNTKALFVFDR